MKKRLLLLLLITIIIDVKAQITDRPRPESWKQLIKGAAFKDRFLPMPEGKLSSDAWGAKNVIPRYIDNGIEDRQRSYWCGDIIKAKNNLYHLYVVGWKESSPKGHFEWPNSIIYHATSKNSYGPFIIKDTIGYGHNVDAFRAKNGKLVLYAIDKNYTANNEDGPWTEGKFDFDGRDRPILEGFSNFTFAQREDGSYLAVCRGGGSWISKTGLSTYYQVSNKTAYPNIEGKFEDPLIWRDNVQYNLIVNDWLGRIAYYLRSKDGVNWITEAGEAYIPGISFHKNGLVENWFKYERMRVFQDNYGRAIQANFAVIDAQKEEDFPNDNHSSKQIAVPLNPGVLITMLTKSFPDAKTKSIKIKIKAEKGFNPQTDIDVKSLRFGAADVVNFGKGAKVISTEKSGEDLVLTFSTVGLGISKNEFAPKLLGKYRTGKILFGYTRVPWVKYDEAIISGRKPTFKTIAGKLTADVIIENLGLSISEPGKIELYANTSKQEQLIAKGDVSPVEKYAKIVKSLPIGGTFQKGQSYDFTLRLVNGNNVSRFDFKAVPTP